MNITFGTNLKITGLSQLDQLSFSIVENPSGSITNNITAPVADCNINSFTRSSGDPNCQLQITQNLMGQTASLINDTPNVVSLDSQGNVTRLADGDARIRLVSPRDQALFARKFARYGSINESHVVSYTAGSLAAHIYQNIAAMLSGKNPSQATMLLYNQNNYSNQSNNAVRNPNNFVAEAGYDFTGITVATSYGGGSFPAALISPRHIICADHVHAQGTCVFLGSDGQYYTATATKYAYVNDSGNTLFDIGVWYLDTPMPAVVRPFKFLPSNWKSYFTLNSRYSEPTEGFLPCITKSRTAQDGFRINRLQLVVAGDMTPVLPGPHAPPSEDVAYATYGRTAHPSFPSGWFSPIISGDSSGQVFLPINGELVLVTSMYNTRGGYNYGEAISYIEAAMNATALAAGESNPAYSLNKVSLSGFPTY